MERYISTFQNNIDSDSVSDIEFNTEIIVDNQTFNEDEFFKIIELSRCYYVIKNIVCYYCLKKCFFKYLIMGCYW
jgi:hypothetical protein